MNAYKNGFDVKKKEKSVMKLKQGDKVKVLIGVGDLKRGDVVEIQSLSTFRGDNILIEDNLGETWWLNKYEYEPIVEEEIDETKTRN